MATKNPTLLRGVTIYLSASTSQVAAGSSKVSVYSTRSDLMRAVKACGGKISFALNSSTTHWVVPDSNEDESWRDVAKIRQATTYSTKIVRESWLVDTLVNNALQPEGGYAPPKDDKWAKHQQEWDAYHAELWDDSTDEVEERVIVSSAPETVQPTEDCGPWPTSTAGLPSVKVSTFKLADKSQPRFPESFSTLKKEVLQWTDVKSNHNKYYAIEVHKGAEGGKTQFRVFTHYGRTDDLVKNPMAGQRECRYINSLEQAKALYASIYQEKTGKKGYRPVSMSSSSIGFPKASSTSETQERASHPLTPVEQLVWYIFEEATQTMTSIAAVTITSRGIETPLGLLTVEQINKGEAVLEKIKTALLNSKDLSLLEDLSGEFYTIIPHRIGRSREEIRAAVIKTQEQLTQKEELLQLMKDLLQVNSSGALSSTAISNKYHALKCFIKELPQNSSIFQAIKNIVLNSQVKNEGIQVERIYALKKPTEHERFEAGITPHDMLFHGSKICNWVGILSRGLLLPKSVVALGGKRTDYGLLGGGLYFAGSAGASAKYTSTGSRGTRLMLVCRVALGSVYDTSLEQPQLMNPPTGFQSVHGVPGPGSFVDDEFVVYDSNQYRFEYLVEFSLPNDAHSSSTHTEPILPKAISTNVGNALPIPKKPLPTEKTEAPHRPQLEQQIPKSAKQQRPLSLKECIGSENLRIKEEEDRLRQLFANSRNSSELRNDFLHCVNVFNNTEKFLYSDLSNEENLPMILNSSAQPKGRSAITSSQVDFTHKFNSFTSNMFENFDWSNVIVAGGCVLACMLSNPGTDYDSSDIDMFIYGLTQEQANEKLRYIYNSVHSAGAECIRTKNAVTILNQHPRRHIQIVLRIYMSPAEVLLGFDIDSCSVCYDGRNVWAIPRAIRALTKRYNLVDMSRRSLTYEVRLYKYSKRGFAVAVPNFSRDRVDPELFSKSLSQVSGLGKLLLMEYHSTKSPAKDNDTIKRNSDGQRGSRALFSSDRVAWEATHNNETQSDYADVIIPWGPHWVPSKILKLLNYRDKAFFFSQKTPDQQLKHRHIFTSGIDGILSGKSCWCKWCTENWSGPINGATHVLGPISWLMENPGTQLLTGSFHPVSDDLWDADAYRKPDAETHNALCEACFSGDYEAIRQSSVTTNQLATPSCVLYLTPLALCMAGAASSSPSVLGSIDFLMSHHSSPTTLPTSPAHKVNNLTHLAVASFIGNPAVVEALLQKCGGTSPSRTPNAPPPLHVAAYYGNVECMKKLLASGCSPLETDMNGRNALHLAVAGGNIEAVNLLLKDASTGSQAKMAQDNGGKTPSQFAEECGNRGILEGAKVKPLDSSLKIITKSHKDPSLDVLSCCLNPSELARALANGGAWDQADLFGVSALHIACLNGIQPSVESLIKAAQMSSKPPKDCYGQTPLHYCVMQANFLAMKTIASKFPQWLDIPNWSGQSPLYYCLALRCRLCSFENDIMSGLPTVTMKSGWEEMKNYFLSAGVAVPAVSPYPIPPLPASQFLQKMETSCADSVPSCMIRLQQRLQHQEKIKPQSLPTKPEQFEKKKITKPMKSAHTTKATSDKPLKREKPIKKTEAKPERKKPLPKSKAPAFGAKSSAFGGSGASSFGFAPGSSAFGSASSAFGVTSVAALPEKEERSSSSWTFSNSSAPQTSYAPGTVSFSALKFSLPAQKSVPFTPLPSTPKALFPKHTINTSAYPLPLQTTIQAITSPTSRLSSIPSKLLAIIVPLAKENRITTAEKNVLKEMTLTWPLPPQLTAAMEAFILDWDIDELADTLKRLVVLQHHNF
ncbi:ankyrin repeat protein [Pelomyxa schiedti]|nr:ankyrin repeat protein [Pelomyxa schiedti]